MRAKRFEAATIREAYDIVREEMGDDAVIISTRHAVTPGVLGFGRREFVEVVAGVTEDETGVPARSLTQDAAAHDIVRAAAEQAAARPRRAPGKRVDVALPQEPIADATAAQETSTPKRPARRRAASPAATSDAEMGNPRSDADGAADQVDVLPAELAAPFLNALAGAARGGPFDVHQRQDLAAGAAEDRIDPQLFATLVTGLQEIRALVERLALDRATEEVERGPAVLKELRAQLMEQGLPAPVLMPLLDRVGASLTADASREAARQAMERRLVAALPKPVALDMTRHPATVFVIGPSGAGKTTLAVRLGLQLQQGGLRVTIASTDVDRAGAPQQLQAYGAAAGLRTRICYTPGELQALIAEGESDIVIVDTAGHNGTRAERTAELNAFMQVARERNVLLTLPATMQAEDLLRLTRAYAPLQPRALALTRCDETACFGGIVGTVAQSGVGVAYTTHDESVGEPARPGDNHALAGAVLLGHWPERAVAGIRARRAG